MAGAAATPSASTKTSKPTNRISGLFNGCIMRLAQALKDPANYGPSTKIVVQECAKQYQDALDDIEIQLLEAKWYLEHQLTLVKVKNEAKAREEGGAVGKRKIDEVNGDEKEERKDAKRVKVDVPKQETGGKSPVVQKLDKPSTESDSKAKSPIPPTKTEEDQQPQLQPQTDTQQPKPTDPSTEPSIPPTEPDSKPPDASSSQHRTPQPDTNTNNPTPQPDFAQPTPDPLLITTPTPAITNDDFNFTSMFGEPSQGGGTANNDTAADVDPLDFLGIGDDNNPFDSALDGSGNLDLVLDGANDNNALPISTDDAFNSLLPSLESYADAPEGNDNTNNDNTTNLGFNLPDLGENEFDTLLSGDGGFDAGGSGFGDGDMNLALGDDAMNIDNMDFESMFKDDP